MTSRNSGPDEDEIKRGHRLAASMGYTVPNIPDQGHDQRKLYSLLASFVPVHGGAEREFEFSEGGEATLILANYQQLLAPVGGSITLGKFGVSATGAGVTLQDRLVSKSGDTKKFACKLTLNNDAFMRIAATCGYNAPNKLSGVTAAQFEAIKAEARAKQTPSSGQAQTP